MTPCPNPFASLVSSLLHRPPAAPQHQRGLPVLTDAQVHELRSRRQQGAKRLDLAREFNASLAAVRAICEGRRRRIKPEATA